MKTTYITLSALAAGLWDVTTCAALQEAVIDVLDFGWPWLFAAPAARVAFLQQLVRTLPSTARASRWP